jgi:hypothetical protein
MDSLLTALDENVKLVPNLKLCQDVYKYEISIKNANAEKSEALKTTILEQIFADNMTPYYSELCAKFEWVVDEEKQVSMRLLSFTPLSCFVFFFLLIL